MTSNLGYINQVYLVVWDAEGIVKAGVTTRKRWRTFVTRGARLVKLYRVPTYVEMFDLETQFDLDLCHNGPRAFESSADAVPYLGNRGGGYMECYRIPKDRIEHMLKVMIEHVPDYATELMPAWSGEHHAPGTSTYERNERTNEESGSVRDRSLRKQRAGVSGDSSRWAARMNAYRYAVAS